MASQVDYAALGKKIRQTQKTEGITQAVLGEKVNLSTAHIGHIERGTRIPSLETVHSIAQALNVSMDYLLLDSSDAGESALVAVASSIKGKDPRQVKIFIVTVKALADKIDEL